MKLRGFRVLLGVALCVIARAEDPASAKATPLHDAARKGLAGEVKAHLAAGADVDAGDADGMTPLMLAALNGRQEILGILLDHSANINARSNDNWSAVMYAASAGKDEVVDMLMECGSMFTALEAVEAGYLRLLHLMRDEYPEALRVEDRSGRTLLHEAVKFNRPEVVQLLIDAGLDVNASDVFRSTVLMECAQGKGRGEVVKLLLDAGADVNARSMQGFPILYEFVRLGDVEMVRHGVEAGADVNAACRFGPRELPLHYAAREENVEIARLLIEHGADLNVPDRSGKTPLQLARYELRELLIAHGAEFPTHDAAAHGDIEAMRELLDKKRRNIEDEDEQGYTALHVAAREGQKEMVAFLLERRADINAWDDKANYPLHLAVGAGQEETVLFLLEKGARVDWDNQDCYTVLDIAANNKDYSMMELLLANGVDPNLRDTVYQRTRLHWACRNVFEDEVKLLLKHGADVNARDKKAMTPLHHLAVGYYWEHLRNEGVDVPANSAEWTEEDRATAAASCRIAEMLLDAGADLSLQRKKCLLNPLHLAAWKGREDLVSVFLNRGADINASSEGGMPIHQAAGGGDLEVLVLLIRRGASIHAMDREGARPLQYAVWNHQPEVAEFLLQRGGEIDAVSPKGNTCLHEIVSDDHIDMIDFLVERGADINKKNARGMTPLDAAMKCEEYRAAEHLRKLGGVEGDTKQVSEEGP